MQFHARNTLQAGHGQEHGDDPVLTAHLRALHDRARADAEARAAADFLAAAERHRRVLAADLNVQQSAIGTAYRTFGPALPNEPFLGFLVGRELAEDRLQANAFAVRLTRRFLPFRHAFSLYESTQIVKWKPGVWVLSYIIP